MDTGTILAIAIPALVVLGAALAFTSARRRDLGDALGTLSRETLSRDAGTVAFDEGGVSVPSGREVELAAIAGRSAVATIDVGTPVPYTPPDPDELGVTRRQFLNRSVVASFALGLSGFGAAVLAFLWPSLGEGFGSTITAGNVDDILGSIADTKEPSYFPEGRFYINPYPAEAVGAAEEVYSSNVVQGMAGGVVALYQKCPHLGCRVPWCTPSQWFECPCHGSQYNRVGEKKGGPAPRGMDRFPVTIDEAGIVSVDTGTVVQGPPIGTNTTGQEAEGPHCAGEGGGDHG